jgi:exodeoxyribonuclease VII large subunit
LKRWDDRLTELAARARRGTSALLLQRRRALASQAQLLGTLGYQNVLKRGFALVRDGSGRTIRSVSDVAASTKLEIEVADGRIVAISGDSSPGGGTPPAGSPEPRTAPAADGGVTRPARRPRGSEGQGSLF